MSGEIRFRAARTDSIIIEIGTNDTAADLARRRPDLFRLHPVGGAVSVASHGGRPVTIVRMANPAREQLPWPVQGALTAAEQLVRRCVARALGAKKVVLHNQAGPSVKL